MDVESSTAIGQWDSNTAAQNLVIAEDGRPLEYEGGVPALTGKELLLGEGEAISRLHQREHRPKEHAPRVHVDRLIVAAVTCHQLGCHPFEAAKADRHVTQDQGID